MTAAAGEQRERGTAMGERVDGASVVRLAQQGDWVVFCRGMARVFRLQARAHLAEARAYTHRPAGVESREAIEARIRSCVASAQRYRKLAADYARDALEHEQWQERRAAGLWGDDHEGDDEGTMKLGMRKDGGAA